MKTPVWEARPDSGVEAGRSPCGRKTEDESETQSGPRNPKRRRPSRDGPLVSTLWSATSHASPDPHFALARSGP